MAQLREVACSKVHLLKLLVIEMLFTEKAYEFLYSSNRIFRFILIMAIRIVTNYD